MSSELIEKLVLYRRIWENCNRALPPIQQEVERKCSVADHGKTQVGIDAALA
jgi:hypothetical protein